MKNSVKRLAITALVAVIGFALALATITCDDGNGGTTGTAPTITTTTLPNGTLGRAYSQILAATGDTPITWSLENGVLPTGLNLLSNGTITGSPTTAGTSNFTVKAANATGSGTKALSILIDEERWVNKTEPSSTAKLFYSVDGDGVCTITVSGTPEPNVPGNFKRHYASAGYRYTAKANAVYKYEFEVWTQSGNRTINVQYFYDSANDDYGLREFLINSERKTFTYTGYGIPKNGEYELEFQCADQLGTFYVKVLRIYETTLEALTAAERWSTSEADDSTATIAHSVGSDDVCTITVGGIPMTAMPGWDYVWKVSAGYAYPSAAGKTYTYTFEAWTSGADRTMIVQWYNDWVNNDIHGTGFEYGRPTFTITSERKTYTITGSEYGFGPIPKSGAQMLEFHCANQLGTFYVKIISIK
jgi:hypothetical protein